MTSEEKDLLLKDLCSRLPYGVIINTPSNIFYPCDREDVKLDSIFEIDGNFHVTEDSGWLIETCKPYLRPMLSMTEEEKKELLTLLVGEDSISYFKVENNEITNTDENIQFGLNWQYHWLNFSNENISLYVDWLNKKHFDYRGLIPMGLALPAPEGMYS